MVMLSVGQFQACAVPENQSPCPALPSLGIEKDLPPPTLEIGVRKCGIEEGNLITGQVLSDFERPSAEHYLAWSQQLLRTMMKRGPCLCCPHTFLLFLGVITTETSSFTPCQTCAVFLSSFFYLLWGLLHLFQLWECGQQESLPHVWAWLARDTLLPDLCFYLYKNEVIFSGY